MANPARRGEDETLESLRRMEPALERMQESLRQVQIDIKDLKTRVSRLDGQVSQLPTLTQILTAVLAANARIVAVGFGLARAIAG